MYISRQEVINNIQMYISQSGCFVSKVETIEEAPNYLRHACAEAGITFLPKQVVFVPQEYGDCIQFPYYYCSLCGKLFVYRFLYD